ncbi:unnamed protein product [Ambrosiozyma monospora]|uniref:Unnamed protein product n=1 Tax=Ambrosiozyma monospora TaxID=43982 RepID=A0A9W6YUC7_AMBMO|nr:unnamed protein product [Ambrosiozyma monospora]
MAGTSFSVELFTWFVQIIVDIFFREVSTRGSFNLPQTGATIVVIAPHANQFLDAAVTMYIVNKVTGRRTAFIEAAASFRRRVVGAFSRWSGAISVERPQDLLVVKPGTITYKNYPDDELTIVGTGTQFTKYCEVKGLLGLPKSIVNAKIAQVISDTELKIQKPISKPKGVELLLAGTEYKVAPRIDNSQLFNNVFDRLHAGDLIAIAAEGGSHDRTQFLPFKPGFAIMALGAAAKYPDTEVNIVPCGLNYFHPNKFRSRAVLEFGEPIVISSKDGKEYEADAKSKVDSIMSEITDAMKAVTQQSPDYETLQVIQAARRLYAYPKKHIPLPLVVEMNRNLLIGYTQYHDDPQIQHLKKSVMDYNKRLQYLGLTDHQLEKYTNNVFKTSYLLLRRTVKLLFLVALSLPGTILFSPVFIACHVISRKKQREALAKSSVKIKGTDVLGSWKVLIALVFAPSLYTFYSLVGTYMSIKYSLLPNWWILQFKVVIYSCCYSLLVWTTYAAFRIGETGMDILKSLRPLVLSLSPKSHQFVSSRQNQ